MDEACGRAVMRAVWLVAALSLLVACASTPRQERSLHGAHDSEGATIAGHLIDRYNDPVADCRKGVSDPDPLPAVLCSGVLMRATRRGAGFNAWNPNPNNPQPNGVSFSWLRKDSAFSALAFGYTNGFIVLPYFFADGPEGYTELTVLCAFAFDGGTDARRSAENDGCGSIPGVANSGPCQAQGVTTVQTWQAKFQTVPNRYWNQCGFTMKPRTQNAYLHFAAMAGIRAGLPNEAINLQNEVMIGAWLQNDAHLPLEAFFYVQGNAAGLGEAKLNQSDFSAATGRWVPVVAFTYPAGLNAPASFTYAAADQAIP